MYKRVLTYVDHDGVERTETVVYKTGKKEDANDDLRYIAPDGTVWTSRKEYLDYVRGD